MSKKKVEKSDIIESLETIFDPDINCDIWTMGLIYDIDIRSETEVFFLMTYTTPFCPAGSFLQQQIIDEMNNLGFTTVEIEVTFEPLWQMPEALKIMLGI